MGRSAIGVCVLIGTVGCGTVSTTGLSTRELSPGIIVRVDEEPGHPRTSIDVVLHVPGARRALLGAGDVLTMDTDKTKGVVLQLHGTEYEATIDGELASQVTVRLARAQGTEALATTVTVPPAITLSPPKKIAWGDARFDLHWTPSPGALFSGSSWRCSDVSPLVLLENPVDDKGAGSIDLTRSIKSRPAAPQCLRVRIDRQVDGVLDPAFQPGWILGIRQSYVDVTVDP